MFARTRRTVWNIYIEHARHIIVTKNNYTHIRVHNAMGAQVEYEYN